MTTLINVHTGEFVRFTTPERCAWFMESVSDPQHWKEHAKDVF